MLNEIVEAIRVIADVTTITASGIAIYVFVAHRGEIGAALRILLNYSYQTTLGELKEKLERLNEYNAGNSEDVPEIRAILHEIAGQIRGNSRLKSASTSLIGRIESTANDKKLTEPTKRSLVAELREVCKTWSVTSVEDIVQ